MNEIEELKSVVCSSSFTPWHVHRTGSHIALRDVKGKPIFRKVVSQCSIEEYSVLLKNLQFIVHMVNAGAEMTELLRLYGWREGESLQTYLHSIENVCLLSNQVRLAALKAIGEAIEGFSDDVPLNTSLARCHRILANNTPDGSFVGAIKNTEAAS